MPAARFVDHAAGRYPTGAADRLVDTAGRRTGAGRDRPAGAGQGRPAGAGRDRRTDEGGEGQGRRRVGAAGAALALVVLAVLLGAAPARAANTFVEVTPNTAQAGSRVNIRASCENGNNNQASVESEAFGRVMLRPDNGFLTGSVTIPGNKPPETYGVNLRCTNGGTATTTLTVVNMSKPTQGPATGGGGTAGSGSGRLMFTGAAAVIAVVAGLWLIGARRSRTGAGG